MTVSHKDMANAIRFLSMDAVQKAKSGHPGMPMGMADVATVLFSQFLKYDMNTPNWLDRDRFILSAGHGSMLLYSLLYLTGEKSMTVDALKNFRQFDSLTPGHPEYGHTVGVETTTGPLGQGIATAVGFAMAEEQLRSIFGRKLVDHHTWVLASDGDLMEGISHEAISLAGAQRLSRLIVLWDDNLISIDGDVRLSERGDQLARFRAAGWQVQRVDGHDPEEIAAAMARARLSSKPSLIACRTKIGFGAPTLEGKHKSHGAPLGDVEIAGAREKLGWSAPPFEVPADILAAWRSAGSRGSAERERWEARLAALPTSARKKFEERMANPIDVAKMRKTVKAHSKALADSTPKLATREASGAALEVLIPAFPALISGSADLTGSNNTITKGAVDFDIKTRKGRYVHYGVREHGMAAAMNGMAIHGGIVPLSGSFLVFADYCRPSLRLAALMGVRVVHVMTHDSIGLGEDGPTHQPVETLASLRAIPNLTVFRPADPVETAECWELALTRTNSPSVMALTRQKLAFLRKEGSPVNKSALGAYVLSPAPKGLAEKGVFVATGSEVEIAIAAQAALAAKGVGVRVVSAPSFDIFAEQSEAYQTETLGGDLPKVGLEAALRFGWDRWIGHKGGFVGMPGFGASAPFEKLYEHFGITADHAVAAMEALI